jgi:hypothetical protein
MSFYRDTIRKARKEHKCELCKATIMVGEQYHDKAGREDDMWYTKECEVCQPIITEYLHWSGEYEYSEEDLKYWWQEEKCPNCTESWRNGGDCDDERMTHYCRCKHFKNKLEVTTT